MRPVGPEAESAGQCLRRLMADNGKAISVESFMREALYHPHHGYYSRRVRTVGRTGDFSTSATLHWSLGRAIAAWAAHHRRSVTRGGAWHLIELGGGTGELAAEVQRSLGWWNRVGLRHHLVEVSDGLRAEQQRRLAGQRSVRWHPDMRRALAAADGNALVYSNEFVDAFPCVQLARDPVSDRWHEVGVAWAAESGGIVEVLQPWDGAPDEAWPRVAGQRVEIHAAYRVWLEEWVARWKAGRMLTIDYGDTPPGLYYRQPRGTLRAYCRHQRFTGLEVYRRFGQQDLTADVNFADLRRWGEVLGLVTEGYGTQADFLRRWLSPRDLRREEREPALAFLLNAGGAGGAFKVLEQSVK